MPSERFEGDRMVSLGKGVSIDAHDFVDSFRVMAQQNEKGEELRSQAWHHCDFTMAMESFLLRNAICGLRKY